MPKYNPNPTRLEAVRRSKKLTRKQLADLCGLNYRTIEAYEQGKNDINNAAIGTVKKNAAVLDVPIEAIID